MKALIRRIGSSNLAVPSIYSIRPSDRGILQECAVRVRLCPEWATSGLWNLSFQESPVYVTTPRLLRLPFPRETLRLGDLFGRHFFLESVAEP